MTTMPDQIELLVVEDDDVDQLSFTRLRDSVFAGFRMHMCSDGPGALAALEHLRGKRVVVVLDLNLPKMSGLEFLERLRADAELATVPVVVLSTSQDQRDVEACYARHVAGYFVKPIDSAEMESVLSAIATYWRIGVIA